MDHNTFHYASEQRMVLQQRLTIVHIFIVKLRLKTGVIQFKVWTTLPITFLEFKILGKKERFVVSILTDSFCYLLIFSGTMMLQIFWRLSE